MGNYHTWNGQLIPFVEEWDLEAEAADYEWPDIQYHPGWHTPAEPAYTIQFELPSLNLDQLKLAYGDVFEEDESYKMAAYETKDSGEHREFDGGGRRDTQEGKPRFDLLFPRTVPYQDQMLTRVAELFERGARKYSGRNWEQFSSPEALEHAEGSFGRHSAQYMCGEKDEDHAAAVIANVLIIEYVKGVLDGRWNALEAS